jgi:hypothetical protein
MSFFPAVIDRRYRQARLFERQKLDDAIYPTTPIRQKEPKIGF